MLQIRKIIRRIAVQFGGPKARTERETPSSVFESPHVQAFYDEVNAHFEIELTPRARRALNNMDDLMEIVRDDIEAQTGQRPNPHALWGTLNHLAAKHLHQA